jgi:DNA-binding CsgD family transcriptional regulator
MNPMNKLPAVLIATLGTEAQVITAALDLLLHAREHLSRVEVLHTTAPGTGIASAVERLTAEAVYYSQIQVSFIPFVTAVGSPLADIKTPQDGEICFRGLYQRVWAAKQCSLGVHLLVAGGRKLESIYGMLTAQLLFDEADCLWYLHSGGDFLTSKRLHPTAGDEVALVPIPVILWSRVSPSFDRLRQADEPFTALKEVEALQLGEKMETSRAFVFGSLTPAEERVVRLLVKQGLSDQEIGEQLCLSPRTVEQHLRSAYQKAAAHWDLDSVTRTQLVSLLNLYYATEIRGKPA